ncbi:MAG: hypothetical protein ACXWMO_04665, partial [Syntrophales bacterium]
AFKSGKKEDVAREISTMDKPLSKLIVVGLLVKKNRDTETDLKLAIYIASQNGWKKGSPGLSWQASIPLQDEQRTGQSGSSGGKNQTH